MSKTCTNYPVVVLEKGVPLDAGYAEGCAMPDVLDDEGNSKAGLLPTRVAQTARCVTWV